jgi:hypothetical protein
LLRLLLLSLLQLRSPDTLKLRPLNEGIAGNVAPDAQLLGPPQVQFRTGQGSVSVWLLIRRDTVLIVANIQDSTPYWGDDFVISFDRRGDGGPRPQHDDFQWYFRRMLDSSVVYRGRGGRWEPPRADPDWRLLRERSGGGWEVGSTEDRTGWSLILRMDSVWFTGEDGQAPRIAFRVYDDAPGGWFSYPQAKPGEPATAVEQTPERWIPLQPLSVPR